MMIFYTWWFCRYRRGRRTTIMMIFLHMVNLLRRLGMLTTCSEGEFTCNDGHQHGTTVCLFVCLTVCLSELIFNDRHCISRLTLYKVWQNVKLSVLLFVCLFVWSTWNYLESLSNLQGVTKRQTVSMNPTRTTASSCSWRWVKPNILKTRTTQYFSDPPWKPGYTKLSWKPGQLQQEDCSLQLWQSEEPQQPGQH